MAPDDTLALEMAAAERETLRAALSQTQGFLLFAGLDEEADRVDTLRERLTEAEPDAPLRVAEPVAVRGVASLMTYRNAMLEEGDIAAAAEVEETVRTLTEQSSILAAVAEVGAEVGGE